MSNATPSASKLVRRRIQAPAFIAPLAVEWEMDGTWHVCAPMDVAQIAQVMELAGGLFDAVAVLPLGMKDRLMAGAPDSADINSLMGLLQDQVNTAHQVVDVAMRWDSGTAGALLPDRFAYTFAVVVQVNADFFSQALPVLKAAGALLQRVKDAAASSDKTQPAGPNSSTA